MDLLKFLAIFLVLWGHAEQHLLSCDYSDRAVYRHIYSFHMPLFMMISGFFFAMTLKPGVFRNVIVKARQLLLPSVCWSLIFVILAAAFHQHLPSVKSIGSAIIGNFWFLKSAFACSILGLIPFLLFKRNFWFSASVSLLLSQALFFIPVVQLSFMYPAFLMGGIIYRYHDRFVSYARWIVPICGFVWIVCNLFLDAEAYRIMKRGLLINPSVIKIIYWRMYMYIMGLCGAVSFIALFEVVFSTPRKGFIYNIATDWGKMTLGIYILQTLLLETILLRYVNFDGVNDILFDFVISPLISLAIMMVCVMIIRVIRLNDYASFFLLGSKWTSHKIQ